MVAMAVLAAPTTLSGLRNPACARRSGCGRRGVALRTVARAEAASPPAVPVPATPAPAKKPRLPGLDSVRFFLIAYIAVGHFIACATRDPTTLAMFTQVNVVVGAFFVLSGYVAGYVATELGKYEASPRIKPESTYFVGRVFGYYPLYLFIQVLFGAMFIYADNLYNGPVSTLFHGLVTLTLTQAWFPLHAELWNAPTWFLSALTFAMLVLPYTLPTLASFRKRALRQCMFVLAGILLVARVAYSYDLDCWTLMEGVTAPKLMPNLTYFNVMRFNPFYALIEVLMGVVACRMVMIMTPDEQKESAKKGVSALVLFGAMAAVIWARGTGLLMLNDMLTRSLLFIPLFTWFCMRVHILTVAGTNLPKWAFTKVLALKPLVYLGTISFPLFIVHGPLGQLFYKKAVATKVWGVVFTKYGWFFPYYLAIVLAAAVALHEYFVKSERVGQWAKATSKKLASVF